MEELSRPLAINDLKNLSWLSGLQAGMSLISRCGATESPFYLAQLISEEADKLIDDDKTRQALLGLPILETFLLSEIQKKQEKETNQ